MPKDGPIYGKFYVERTDGRDQPGGDKEDASYFVLDIVNDPYAREALMFYAFKCVGEYPKLSADIWRALKVDVDHLITKEVPVISHGQDCD